MKKDTFKRKEFFHGFKQIPGEEWLLEKMSQIIVDGKQAFDILSLELGRMLAETIMYMEREELAGPDYMPISPEVRKWASQGGSVYVGDQKLKLSRPRLRGPEGEIALKSYQKLKTPHEFSHELLAKVLRGLSGRRYHETVTDAAKSFGVSASSVSRHIVEATVEKLKVFKERSLSTLEVFALYLDTIHRAGSAFVVALGIDVFGTKTVLGFWEGATENHEICNALFFDLESRGLVLSNRILFVTDGGSGILKSLRNRFGKKFFHQRCVIHKDRNIQMHLPERYRKAAHHKFKTALEQKHYQDAKQMLLDFEKWLRKINESSADSLLEALEEILTVHRLGVPELLRKTLKSTNPIESMFSKVRHCEKNIKRYRGSNMAQRWLGAVLLHAEERFHKVEGHKHISEVLTAIKTLLTEPDLPICELAQTEERKLAA